MQVAAAQRSVTQSNDWLSRETACHWLVRQDLHIPLHLAACHKAAALCKCLVQPCNSSEKLHIIKTTTADGYTMRYTKPSH